MLKIINQESSDISVPKSRGGARAGAGRPKMSPIQRDRWMRARGISPLMAAEILAKVVDERATWQRIFKCDDERVILQAMMFLVSMRDGKPAQQINVTSQNVTVTVDDVAKARAIVRELMSPSRPQPVLEAYDDAGHVGEGEANAPIVRREETANAPLMLLADEGSIRGGGV